MYVDINIKYMPTFVHMSLKHTHCLIDISSAMLVLLLQANTIQGVLLKIKGSGRRNFN